jgi:hypothetical protein
MLKLAFKPVLHEDCLRQWLSGATDQVLVVVASVMMKHEETGAQGSEEYCVAFGLELCLSLVGALGNHFCDSRCECFWQVDAAWAQKIDA